MNQLKKTVLAYTIWFAACYAGCTTQPTLTLSNQADSTFTNLRYKALRAHAERIDCLITNPAKDSILGSYPAPWQAVARDGTSAISFSECPEGTVHPHIFPGLNGTLDDKFSAGDSTSMQKDKTYCILYSDHEARCRTPTWEGTVHYGR